MAPQRFEKFISSLKNLYNTDTFSDVIVVCDGQQFRVHGVILSAHSKYFATELNGEWKESSEKKIEIKDFDPSIVEAMFCFMYSFDYTNTCSTSTMIFEAQVYQIADKYDIPTLKDYSKNKFGTAIRTGWIMDDFPLAITLVYASTPSEDRGLRDLVIETSHANISKLVGHDGFCEILRQSPDFAADLVPFLCTQLSMDTKTKRYRCPSCAYEFPGEFTSNAYYYCPKCGNQRSNWTSH